MSNKTLKQTEVKVEHSDIETEDSGCAKILTVVFNEDDEENGMFVRIQSWDDDKKHIDFNKMIGKKIKVTIEIEE